MEHSNHSAKHVIVTIVFGPKFSLPAPLFLKVKNEVLQTNSISERVR